MPPNEPRRFLVAVGVETYDDQAWDRLKQVPHEVAGIVHLFTGPSFGLTRILKTESTAPRAEEFETSLANWAANSERQLSDQVVLYWSGHGAELNKQLVLVLPDTQGKTMKPSVAAERLVEALVGETSRVGPVLLILDVCYAGQAGPDMFMRLDALTRGRPRVQGPQIAILSATRSRDKAEEGVFVDAFVKAVRYCEAKAGILPAHLSLGDINAEIRRNIPSDLQRPEVFMGAVPDRCFFRNPNHDPDVPEINLALQEGIGHFIAKARGVADLREAGWFFAGRTRVFSKLCEWLRTEPALPALCRLTGSPGAGKSAVLGRLVMLARPGYRARIPASVLAETEAPPPGAIDATILARNKTFPEVLHEISQGLNAPATSARQLVSELKTRVKRPVLVIDEVDEAKAPERIRKELLEPLAREAAKIIVGARRSTFGEAGLADIDLDAEPWADPEAVVTYVSRLLRDAIEQTKPAPRRWHQDIEGTARFVGERVGGNFLLARLIANGLISGKTGDPGDPGWRFPASVGEAFDTYLAGVLGDDEPRARGLLTALAFAEGTGLPPGRLWLAIAEMHGPGPYSDDDVRPPFDRPGSFIVEGLEAGDSVYHLYHAALAEHLRSDWPEQATHAGIARILQKLLSHADGGPPDNSGDARYARRRLSAHLRLAGMNDELARLVTDRTWHDLEPQSGLLDRLDYARDVDEAYLAAEQADRAAAKSDTNARHLDIEVWSMLWRSTTAARAELLPANGWAALVSRRVVRPDVALAHALAVGDEEIRARRLQKLGPLLRGDDLDALLDAAKRLRDTKHCCDVLIAALSGPEPRRIVPRLLEAAESIKYAAQHRLIEAALPWLIGAELDRARALIEAMRPNDRAPLMAEYLAERVRRGDTGEVRQTLETECAGGLLRGFVVAALLRLQNRPSALASLLLSVGDEFELAERTIEDEVYRFDVQTEFVASLGPVHDVPQRKILASYLRTLFTLRSYRYHEAVLSEGVRAGQALAAPHGHRLLRWIGSWLKGPESRHACKLAVAFARRGDLERAFDILDRTLAKDMSGADLAVSLLRVPDMTDSDRRRAAAWLFDHYNPQLPRDAQLELLGGIIDWLNSQQQDTTLANLTALSIGDNVAPCRGRIHAALVRYVGRTETPALEASFLGAIESVQGEADRAELLEAVATNFAAMGDGEATVRLLKQITDPRRRARGHKRSLERAADEAVPTLIRNLVGDEAALKEFWSHGLDLLLDQVPHLSGAYLDAVEKTATAAGTRSGGSAPKRLLAALAVRHFELQDEDRAAVLLTMIHNPLALLQEAARLPLTQQRALLTRAGVSDPSASTNGNPLVAALSQLLVADLAEADEGVATAETDLDRAMHGWAPLQDWKQLFRRPGTLGLLSLDERGRLLEALFEADLRWATHFRMVDEDTLRPILPWLEITQIDRLLEAADRWEDDYRREEARVLVLRRVAELKGIEAAFRLRSRVVRSDWVSLSWAAIWPCLPPETKATALSRVLSMDGHAWDVGRAFRDIGPYLSLPELDSAVRWVATQKAAKGSNWLAHLAAVAFDRPRHEAYQVWCAALDKIGHRSRGEALAYLGVLMPLAGKLGGAKALRDINQAVARAADWWP